MELPVGDGVISGISCGGVLALPGRWTATDGYFFGDSSVTGAVSSTDSKTALFTKPGWKCTCAGAVLINWAFLLGELDGENPDGTSMNVFLTGNVSPALVS